MAFKTRAHTAPDAYFDLVKRLPLMPIRDDNQLSAAEEVIDRLLEKDLNEGEQAYLDVLTSLVEAYEDANVPIPDASEADVLRELMRLHNLSQQELRRATGIAQSTISAVLCGARSLTKGQVVSLAKFFHVSPAVFLPA